MDAKERWPVVKFLIAATGLNRRDSRAMLEEMPKEKWSKLWLAAQNWDRDIDHQANVRLTEILGDEQLGTLTEAVRRAQQPAYKERDDNEPRTRRTLGTKK